MKVDINPGKYVVAVSGGVDSMVLLDILAKKHDLNLVVAHVDHGIREDSKQDRVLVESRSKALNLKFEYAETKLGSSASEATAREARYNFLREVLELHGADAIITAHHQDDLIETAILNMLRGTGRKGITSLNSSEKLIRPLLEYSKQDILSYAKSHKLIWNEDSTNSDTKYLRNYVRHNLLAKFSDDKREELLKNISDMEKINNELDEILNENLRNDEIDRVWFNQLPHEVACEVLVAWLRKNSIRDFDSNLIEKLTVNAKVASDGKKLDVKGKAFIQVSKKHLSLYN